MSPAPTEQKAWVTLLTKSSYLPGTLVLEHSLRSVRSKYPLVCMVTPSLPEDVRQILQRQGIITREIHPLYPERRRDLEDKRFRDTWTKLRSFALTEYERVVMLDSDMLVVRNMDELLEMDLKQGHIAAAHVCACNPRKIPHYPSDWVPHNCPYNHPKQPAVHSASSPRPYGSLNSGLVALRPSEEDMRKIEDFLTHSPQIEGYIFPDQDLLAEVWRGRWAPLPWYYNALKTLRVVHERLWKDEEVKCVHYILAHKPWHTRPGPDTYDDMYDEVNRWWWAEYDKLEKKLRSRPNTKVDWEMARSFVAS